MNNDDINNLEDDIQLALSAESTEEVLKEMEEWVFTNDKSNPMIRQLFHLFYNSVFKNKLGLMHALHEPTKEVHTILVGVEITPEGVVTWPIAKILTEDQQGQYKAPDGEGNYA